MDLAEPITADAAFIDGLSAIVGADGVQTNLPERVFFSTDIFVQGITAEVVVKPTSIEALSAAVAYCTGAGRAVVPRGSGFSYTQGYVPVRERSVTFDMQGMTRILEINAKDLWVKVEVGTTWTALYDALKEKGYRTPYFGPMSGFRSTVGGALSQGSFFLGSTQYGTTADTTLGLQVVLADGTIVTTGSAASTVSDSPFMRNYGPDLTGLFLHDAGALALKAVAWLKLIPFPKHHRYATFGFEDQHSGVAAMSAIARAGLAAECYLWDPTFAKGLHRRNSVVDDLRYLKGVAASGSSILGGMRNAARMAIGGRKVLEGDAYLLHVTMDDLSDAGAEERLKQVQSIAASHDGAEINNAIPLALRGMPFNDFVPFAQQDPVARNLPTHGIFPHSKIARVCADVQEYFAANKALMDQHGITQGTICFAVGSTMVCNEPLIYWRDEQLAAHDRATNTSDLAVLERLPDRPAAAVAVAQIRQGLVDLFTAAGSGHCQIGKAYRYRQTRKPETLAVLQAIKEAVDPHCLINPGALGLIETG